MTAAVIFFFIDLHFLSSAKFWSSTNGVHDSPSKSEKGNLSPELYSKFILPYCKKNMFILCTQRVMTILKQILSQRYILDPKKIGEVCTVIKFYVTVFESDFDFCFLDVINEYVMFIYIYIFLFYFFTMSYDQKNHLHYHFFYEMMLFRTSHVYR